MKNEILNHGNKMNSMAHFTLSQIWTFLVRNLNMLAQSKCKITFYAFFLERLLFKPKFIQNTEVWLRRWRLWHSELSAILIVFYLCRHFGTMKCEKIWKLLGCKRKVFCVRLIECLTLFLFHFWLVFSYAQNMFNVYYFAMLFKGFAKELSNNEI